MAQADNQQQAGRPLLHTLRVSPEERAYLQRAAVKRGTTMSDLVRKGLRAEGVPIAAP
jgi:uncharacterized protein (DUF1778 family)